MLAVEPVEEVSITSVDDSHDVAGTNCSYMLAPCEGSEDTNADEGDMIVMGIDFSAASFMVGIAG